MFTCRWPHNGTIFPARLLWLHGHGLTFILNHQLAQKSLLCMSGHARHLLVVLLSVTCSMLCHTIITLILWYVCAMSHSIDLSKSCRACCQHIQLNWIVFAFVPTLQYNSSPSCLFHTLIHIHSTIVKYLNVLIWNLWQVDSQNQHLRNAVTPV